MQPADVTRRTLLKDATAGTGVAAFSTTVMNPHGPTPVVVAGVGGV